MPSSRLPAATGHRLSEITGPLLLTISLLVPAVSSAQSIKLDGSLGSRTALTGPNYAIPHDLGQTRGANLFHSFEQFNILTGESATFTGPDTISRVISRVTGGVQSFVDGLLGTEFAGAKPELYLINPSGLLFGPNASLNVAGSVHFSTADYLRFTDQTGQTGLFARLSESTSLSAEPVAAYGFLTTTPAAISNQGGQLTVGSGQIISFVGGDITLASGRLRAPSGLVQLGSTRLVEEVPAQISQMLADHTLPRGDIRMSQAATVNVAGDGGGTVVIRGGRLVLDRGRVFADNEGSSAGARMAVDIHLTGEATLTNTSLILADAFASGPAGDISMRASTIALNGGSQVGGTAKSSGTGGQVRLEADGPLTITGTNAEGTVQSAILANTTGTSATAGSAGTILLVSQDTLIADGAMISSTTLGKGTGGAVRVQASRSVTLTGESPDGKIGGGIFSNSRGAEGGAGRSGDIQIETPHLTVEKGARVSSSSFGSGAAGMIIIDAPDSVHLAGEGQISTIGSGLFANANRRVSPAGAGGDIFVNTRELRLTGGAQIGSTTRGPGPAGTIWITARDLVALSGDSPKTGFQSGVFADSAGAEPGAGRGGDIVLSSSRLLLEGGAQMGSNSAGPGDGGTVLVNVNESVTLAGTGPNSRGPSGLLSTARGTGDGGDITINSKSLIALDGAQINTSVSGAGRGGAIHITTTEDITVMGANSTRSFPSGFRAVTTGQSADAGRAGDIDIDARNLSLTDGQISTATRGPGKAGAISVAVTGTVTLTGTNDPAFPAGLFASSESRTPGAGPGGNILVSAARVRLENGAQVSSNSFGPGTGGMISITADSVFLTGPGTNFSAQTFGQTIQPADLTLTLTIRHTFDSDLIAQLFSPSGARVLLFANVGQAGDNFTGTRFSDTAATPIGSGTAPFADTFKPSESFANLVGQPATGLWTLRVRDVAPPDVGSLDNWSLAFGNLVFHSLDVPKIIPDNTTISSVLNVDVGSGALIPAAAVPGTKGGPGGMIVVTSDSLRLEHGAGLLANTTGSGRAGDVVVISEQVALGTGSRIASESKSIRLDAGGAGQIDVTVPGLLSMAGSQIATDTAEGLGGNINVRASALLMNDGSLISTRSTGTGNSGNIFIVASDLFRSHKSEVTTEATQAFGGNIEIQNQRLVHLIDSTVSTSVKSGVGNGGNITIDPPFVTLDNSKARYLLCERKCKDAADYLKSLKTIFILG